MSRFVSGGTDENPTERDEAWLKAQQEIDARHVAKQAADKAGEGKSLYETLQANKAAKQDAFEESIRLTNQFRSLDEDEIDFLDSINESSRAKEAEVKKETGEQLELFRRQREDAEKAAKQSESVEPEPVAESWSVGRKRKKGKEGGIGRLKVRRTSTTEKAEEPIAAKELKGSPASRIGKTGVSKTAEETDGKEKEKASGNTGQQKAADTPGRAPALGLLAAYSSDED